MLSVVLSFPNWSGQVQRRTCLYKLQLLHLYKKTMSNGGYKIRNPGGIHFITFAGVEIDFLY